MSKKNEGPSRRIRLHPTTALQLAWVDVDHEPTGDPDELLCIARVMGENATTCAYVRREPGSKQVRLASSFIPDQFDRDHKWTMFGSKEDAQAAALRYLHNWMAKMIGLLKA